jgi:hypothetical protein
VSHAFAAWDAWSTVSRKIKSNTKKRSHIVVKRAKLVQLSASSAYGCVHVVGNFTFSAATVHDIISLFVPREIIHGRLYNFGTIPQIQRRSDTK